MFGRQDDHPQDNNQIPQQSIDNAMAGESPQLSSAPPETAAPAVPQSGDASWQHPGSPLETDPATAISTVTPAPSNPVVPDDSGSDNNPPFNPNDLLEIKQKALAQLSPLVGHLDQTPEEKFRTTMMMIQASDDQSMISTAYEAAKAISDERIRAQALLDVVNEINYFTQNLPQNG